ncbi:hypothetical protein SHKM778_14040 [Streptomyces sp. KM77-8]|uniref:Uncharacterized protein n=1 Tax=Streptomyces haneummycinicus TaxID=3074435 RepID=A0AAT9HC94_9ACTN
MRTSKPLRAFCRRAYFSAFRRSFARAVSSSSAASSSEPLATAQERSASAADRWAPGPASGLLSLCGSAAAVTRAAAEGSISARSTVPALSAEIRLSRGTSRSTIFDSFTGSPHQRALRTRVTSSSSVSTFFTVKGPAVTLSFLRAPSLKASGVPMTSFGYRV